MKSCAIYARVSSSDQSCELQITELQEFAARRDWNVIVIFEEKFTGTKANRPKLNELQRLVAERKVDVVLIWKLDRLFRSLKDLLSMLQDWSDLGVELCSLKDGVDLSTSSGRLLMQLIGAFAEFEGSLIRERVRSGIANAKRKGVQLGRPPLVGNADHAKQLRASGCTIRQIAKELKIGNGSVQKLLAK